MGSEEVDNLWKKPSVTKRILNFVFDEGHCIRSASRSILKSFHTAGPTRCIVVAIS